MKSTVQILGAAGLLGAISLLGGCGGGNDSGLSVPTAAPTTTTVATTTTTSIMTVSQTGSLAPKPAADAAPTGWLTAEALKLIDPTLLTPSMKLIEQFDSSGPDAWTPPAHGIVHVTTNGPGYGGYNSRDWKVDRVDANGTRIPMVAPMAGTAYTADCRSASTGSQATCANPNAPIWQGLSIFDANTRLPLATAYYPDRAPGSTAKNAGTAEDHGIGVSPDGKWIYVQGSDARSTGAFASRGNLNIINARTLKVDKSLNANVHHVRTFKYGWDKTTAGAADPLFGKGLVLVDGWNNQFFVFDPSDDNKVVKAVSPTDLAGAGYIAHVDYDGKYMFITVRTGFSSEGGVAILDLRTMKVVKRLTTGDTSPIWTVFSANNKYAYVSSGHSSKVARIDKSDANPANWFVTGEEPSGAVGPYGVTLNWTDTIVFAMEKEEGSGNRGGQLGIARAGASFGGNVVGPLYLNGCVRPDHAVVHPDPAMNEMWVSCNSSMENIIVNMGDGKLATASDLNSYYVKKVLIDPVKNPMGNVENPNYGSSHGGAFVKYNPTTWAGEVQTDTNGFHGAALVTYKAKAAAAGN